MGIFWFSSNSLSNYIVRLFLNNKSWISGITRYTLCWNRHGITLTLHSQGKGKHSVSLELPLFRIIWQKELYEKHSWVLYSQETQMKYPGVRLSWLKKNTCPELSPSCLQNAFLICLALTGISSAFPID